MALVQMRAQTCTTSRSAARTSMAPRAVRVSRCAPVGMGRRVMVVAAAANKEATVTQAQVCGGRQGGHSHGQKHRFHRQGGEYKRVRALLCEACQQAQHTPVLHCAPPHPSSYLSSPISGKQHTLSFLPCPPHPSCAHPPCRLRAHLPPPPHLLHQAESRWESQVVDGTVKNVSTQQAGNSLLQHCATTAVSPAEVKQCCVVSL